MKIVHILYACLIIVSCSSSDTDSIEVTPTNSLIPPDTKSPEKEQPEQPKEEPNTPNDEDPRKDSNTDFEQPGPSNTGPNNASILVKSGNVVVDSKWSKGGSGTIDDPFIVENLDISGNLKIKTSNVIVRNFKVVTNSLYPVQTNNVDGVTNVTLEDGEIMGGSNTSATILAKDGVTLKRLRLHETKGDGVKIQGSNFTMESCWIYNLGTGEKAHADGVQVTVNGNGVRWKNHKYLGNFFDMSVSKLKGIYKANTTIFLHANKKLTGGEGIDGIIIEKNWLIGGNFCLHIGKGMSDVVIKDNKYGYKDVDVRFGNERFESPVEVSGSIYYDTEKPIQN